MRRVDIEFRIRQEDDVERAQSILEELVGNHPKVLEDPEPIVKLDSLEDSSVTFICRPWAKTTDYGAVYWSLTKAVKQRFKEEGIAVVSANLSPGSHILLS